MPAEEIDLVDEILGPTAAGQWMATQADVSNASIVVDAPVAVTPKRRFRFRGPFARTRFGRRQARWVIGFALAFALGAIACLAVFATVAVAAFNVDSNRAVAGVRTGSVDLSGLTRDQVAARLRATYAYLDQGEVTVTTPTGSAKIAYQALGRTPDVEFMADEAMRIGHSGDPIGDAVAILRTAVNGQTFPVVVRVDPTAVATSVRQLIGANVMPLDAVASVQYGKVVYSSSASGFGIDEGAISAAIIDHLTTPDAPASFQAGGAFVELQPRVSDKDAQAAIATAQKMIVDINVTLGGDAQAPVASPVASPGSSQASNPPKTYTIGTDTVVGWIVFQTNTDGTYGPAADPARMVAYLSGLSQQARIAPVEPKIVFDGSGAPPRLAGGIVGTDIDVAATAQVIAAYLDSLASGGKQVAAIAAIPEPVAPNLTVDSLSHMVQIGTWTTTFYPDISNGNGANIRVPAALLNGQVVAPGQKFSFFQAVSPIDLAHGYAMGGVIEHGRSNHTGAIGGGICSASTTMFNAAARAGLQIDERHAHFYYIDRYPVGLDATVYSDGYQLWDVKWTNDTPNPIVIVAGSTSGSKSTITVQLWSLPLDRTVTFSPEFKANVVRAGDRTEYVSTLKPGQQARAEYPTNGYDTSRTRLVTDSTGKVIHTETWTSHYAVVNGLLLIGAP
jgi:vancomycin resistance protein YoaR